MPRSRKTYPEWCLCSFCRRQYDEHRRAIRTGVFVELRTKLDKALRDMAQTPPGRLSEVVGGLGRVMRTHRLRSCPLYDSY